LDIYGIFFTVAAWRLLKELAYKIHDRILANRRPRRLHVTTMLVFRKCQIETVPFGEIKFVLQTDDQIIKRLCEIGTHCFTHCGLTNFKMRELIWQTLTRRLKPKPAVTVRKRNWRPGWGGKFSCRNYASENQIAWF